MLLVINNIVIGRAQSLQAQRSYGTEGVYEIGSIMPQEHVYNRYEGQITLERFLVRKDSLYQLGMAGLGEDILEKGVIDLAVFQKAGGTGTNGQGGTTAGSNANAAYNESKCIRVYRGLTAVSYSENVRVGAICGENATFQYMTCDDNAGSGGYLSGTTGNYTSGSINAPTYANNGYTINGLSIGGGQSSTANASTAGGNALAPNIASLMNQYGTTLPPAAYQPLADLGGGYTIPASNWR